MSNIDEKTVEGFDEEWQRFDQSAVSAEELAMAFDQYFSEFPWAALARDAVGADFGCGSGRWARFVAPRVGQLHLVDAAPGALAVAQKALADYTNCVFHASPLDRAPLPDSSLDFGYSLGVLHHIPDTQAALAACVRKLKPGAPFLLYLYYRFDNRPAWYAQLWRTSELVRGVLSKLPYAVKHAASDALAAGVYYPLARTALLVEALGGDPRNLPLSYYRHRSFYAMRTDALDRFGTRLEQRFTRVEIEKMMRAACLEDIRFRDGVPYWCAVGVRRSR